MAVRNAIWAINHGDVADKRADVNGPLANGVLSICYGAGLTEGFLDTK